MVTCGAPCCACDGAGDKVAAAMAAALKYRLVVRIIGALLVRSLCLGHHSAAAIRLEGWGGDAAERSCLISMHSPLPTATASVAGSRERRASGTCMGYDGQRHSCP